MKAQTQIRIGLITAGILFIAGICMLVFWWDENIVAIPLYFSPQMVLCLIYIYALIKKNLRIADTAYLILWALGLFYLVALISGSPKAGDILEVIIQLLLCFCLPYGGVVLLWWIGLRGLQRIVETERMSTDEQKQ